MRQPAACPQRSARGRPLKPSDLGKVHSFLSPTPHRIVSKTCLIGMRLCHSDAMGGVPEQGGHRLAHYAIQARRNRHTPRNIGLSLEAPRGQPAHRRRHTWRAVFMSSRPSVPGERGNAAKGLVMIQAALRSPPGRPEH